MSHPRAWTGAAVGLAVAAALLAPTTSPSVAATPAVVGAQTSGDSLFPAQGNGGYDVSHYDLDLAWQTSGAIAATARISASTTGEPLSQLSLDLEGLTVSRVTVDGVDAAFSRINQDPAFKLVVTPATPVSGAFVVEVTYAGTPTSHTDPDGSSEGWVATTGLASGAVALNEPVGAMTWFPNNNTPRDKATFTTTVTVPFSTLPVAVNRVAVSNGVLTSTETGATTRTFTWEQPKQQATYLAMVGIGQYTVSESDVALTSGTTHEWSYADPTAAGSTQFATSRGKLSAILKGLEKHYGPYPGSSTGLVLDVSSLGYALETQDRPYFENSIDEPTLFHELAHQWFGDAVSPADWGDVWLNEGPATYLETQLAADLNGSASTQDTYYADWSSSNAAFWATPAAGFTDPADLFGSQVYARGAIALEALRSSLGDAVFTEVMRTWIETYGGSSATTAQFIALAESVSGYDLTDFFQTWVYGTTKPAAWPVAYELSLASSPATGATVGGGSAVSYTLRAVNSGKVPTGASTVEVDVTDLVAQGTLGALPAGVTRSGDTLVWAVPATAVGSTATTTVTATLDHPVAGPLAVGARGRTLGADCGACASTLTVSLTDVASATPTVEGVARVDQTLTALPGAWDPDATLTYQWRRAGAPITGATEATYAPVAGDVDKALTVTVTGTRTGYAAASRTSAPVTVARGVQARRPRPWISGVTRVGRTLRAVVGAHDPGVTVRVQWLVDGKVVRGATARTFQLRRRDRGLPVRVATRATKPGYVTVVKVSTSVRVRR
ncbi:M1 family metallopeptidase [Nocardioides rubriscoriae]|uniref:M1 family metallopeptidase n=1 Tax=Nocardioides rubriscoriae TaxID=642762 RepID=UPI0011DFFE42|nr:M1 family metallopeptidase [Nocardioides rubriscoriae]